MLLGSQTHGQGHFFPVNLPLFGFISISFLIGVLFTAYTDSLFK